MKRYLPLLLILIAGCSKPQKVYIAKVYQTGILGMSVDTIKSETDSHAYLEGGAFFIGCKTVDSVTKIGIATGFDVYDSDGVSLKFKLPPHQIDSLNKIIALIKLKK